MTLRKLVLLGIAALLVAVSGWAILRPSAQEKMPNPDDYVIRIGPGEQFGFDRELVAGCEGNMFIDSFKAHSKASPDDGLVEAEFFFLSDRGFRTDVELLEEKPYMVFVWKESQDDNAPRVLLDLDRNGFIDQELTWEEMREKAGGVWCGTIIGVK